MILYSSEDLRELLSTHSSVLGRTPEVGKFAALVTATKDLHNLELLLSNPLITSLLPVRNERMIEDGQNHAGILERVISSDKHSLVLANHDGAALAKLSLWQSSERLEVIRKFGDLAAQASCFLGFPEICKTVCSELLTNAFYNAPRDEMGRPLVTDRKQHVTLKKPVDVEFGEDAKFLWLQVSDAFGTFSRQALLENLLRSTSADGIQVNLGPGGAGIGLYMVFRWSAQLLFSFEQGHETKILIKLLKTKRHKIFDSQRAILEVLVKH